MDKNPQFEDFNELELKDMLEQMLEISKKFIELTGLNYDYYTDEYLTPNVKRHIGCNDGVFDCILGFNELYGSNEVWESRF